MSSAPEDHDHNADYDIYAWRRSPQGSVRHTEYPRSPSAASCYLPTVIAALAASVGIVIGSGPWASRAWITANGATASACWPGGTTFLLGAVAGIASFTLLNRAKTGSGTRWLGPLAWIAAVAGLVCLLIAIISIVNVTSTSHQLVGVQVDWGLRLVAVSAVVLCATASVAVAQVGTVTEPSRAGMRTAIAIAAVILLGVALYLPVRWIVINPQPSRNQQQPTIPTTVPSAQSTPPLPGSTTVTPPPEDPEVAEVAQLWQTALQKHHPVRDFLAAVQAAGIIGAEPALLENGYNACWELWDGGYTGVQAAAAMKKIYPTLTIKQAGLFVIAAYENLCPVRGAPGAYDWWAYSTS